MTTSHFTEKHFFMLNDNKEIKHIIRPFSKIRQNIVLPVQNLSRGGGMALATALLSKIFFCFLYKSRIHKISCNDTKVAIVIYQSIYLTCCTRYQQEVWQLKVCSVIV